MPKRSITCFLGAGYSFISGVPLARGLLRADALAFSERSYKRFAALREHYEEWQERHPTDYPEQYLGCLYTSVLPGNPPPWNWAVEYVSAVIASAGTPPASMNRNPRYSNRLNRPSRCAVHRRFWSAVVNAAGAVAVLTTNY